MACVSKISLSARIDEIQLDMMALVPLFFPFLVSLVGLACPLWRGLRLLLSFFSFSFFLEALAVCLPHLRLPSFTLALLRSCSRSLCLSRYFWPCRGRSRSPPIAHFKKFPLQIRSLESDMRHWLVPPPKHLMSQDRGYLHR